MAQCHLAKYGHWLDLAGRLDLGDLNEFASQQNGEMYSGTAEKPAVMSPVLMVFEDSPFKCTSREGERLAENFVLVEDQWAPRVQIMFDRLPLPPLGPPSAAYIMDADVQVTGLELVDNGTDLPHAIQRVAFEQATYNSVDNGQKSPLYTITREETESKAVAAADGSALDVVGVTLGMSLEEADAVLRQHLGEPIILEPQFEPSPNTAAFTRSRMYVRPDKSERVLLFYEDDGDAPRVLGVERKLDSPDWKLPRKAVVRSAIKKYGEPQIQLHGGSTEMVWGDNVGTQIDDNSFNWTWCRIQDQAERTEAWTDANGESHFIYQFFTSGNAYNARLAYPPSLEGDRQDEFIEEHYQKCGKYLRLSHSSFGLTVMLTDLKDYTTSYLKARERLKQSFQDVSSDDEEAGADIEL